MKSIVLAVAARSSTTLVHAKCQIASGSFFLKIQNKPFLINEYIKLTTHLISKINVLAYQKTNKMNLELTYRGK